MVIVIIAGGQGTRLWPLSKSDYPKHLLSLVNKNSLLQNTVERAEKLTNKIYVIPESSHIKEVKKQIPKLKQNIITEPARRGTANCIIFALSRLKPLLNPNEVIVFLHADSHINDVKSFTKAVRTATEASRDLKRIALIGVNPDYPATGFGYIKTGNEIADYNGQPVLKVESFVEKPDELTARRYLKSKQYLWNMGLFAASIDTFEQAIKAHNESLWERYQQILNSDQIEKDYLGFPSEPIDTALIEKMSNLAVIPGHFDWVDVGSFKDLYEILRDGQSNVHKGQVYDIESQNTLVIANNKPILTIGLNNMVVVDTDEGILICPKELCQLVKDGVAKIEQNKKN